jgi:subtilisin-like proprotein convertase family protein
VNNDPLTYLWEQYDTGPSGAPNSPSGTAPLFRDWVPVIENYRVFPRMEDLVRNQQTLGEILPSYARSMNFRLTVRDNVPGGAGLTNNNTLVTLTVANTTTPFRVTQPNTALNWFANATQTVTWDVSSTDIAPINCTQVNILLSIDSGYTYPYTLLANTPNDGTASVTLPNVISNKARIKVESVGNIFFDISNVNFTISSASPILTLITTSPLTSNSLCAGSNVSVDYSVDGPANAGNVFTAQLSNASGSFASPVNIGSLSATGAGVIAATIPGGTVPGTGYRIRVVSSNPAVIGSDNGTNITLSQPAGTPGGITGSVLVCQGQAGVNYSISPVVNATSYQWTLPSGASITSGNNTNTITVSFSAGATSGNVIVQGSNAGCGNGPASSPLAVTVNTLPATAGAVTGSATICQGQQGVSYSTSVIPGASGYAWTLPAGATIATGANTNSITVDFATNAASGSISVAGTNTCGAGASSSFSLSALPVPTSAVIMAGGPVSFCTGGDVELSYTQDINTVYQWRKNGLEILGETGATYTASTSGDYDVVAAAPQEYNDGTLYSIPDNSCTGASSTIAVSGYSGAIPSAGISVRVNITHTWVGDLVLMLEDPNGGILGLSNRTGNTSNSGDNFTNTVFSDAGAAVLPTTGAPYTGIYKPVSTTFTSCLTTTLTTFGAIGGGTINPNGNWILRVYDRAGADVGTINNWSISFPASLYGPCFSVSNAVTVTVSSPVTAGISITANPGNTICSGASVTFTATPVNGGGSPSYQWKNGLANAGANSSVYTTATLGNGDVIRCVLTSDAVCVTNNPVTSNAITMTVNPTPSVVSFAPTTGSPGATVTINGSGFTGATAVSFNGTPASFVVTNDNQVSATVPGGATTGQISVTSPCGTSFSASNFMVLTGGLVTLNIKLFLEGFYQPGAGGGGMMNDNFGGGGLLYFLGYSPNASDVDTVFISAMDANTFAEVNRKPAILHLDGSASVTFDPVVNGGVAYYIKVNHRNSIETWSAGPVFLMSTYDFTTAPAKAYGNNMVQTYDSQGWAFYSGDISEAGLGQAGVQDGVIESQDYGDMENAVANLLVGYVYSDLTGDGVTESSDYSLMDNNVTTVIVSMHP